MEQTFRGRKVLALAAAIPLVIGLTACANGNDGDKPQSRSTSSANTGGGGSGGGLLPFGPGGNGPGPGPTGPEPGPDPTGPEPGPTGGFGGGGGGVGGGGGGGGATGSDIVRFGNVDLSSIDWQTVCTGTGGTELFVSGSDKKYASSNSADGATFLVTTDSSGKVDSVYIFNEDSTEYLMYSSTSASGSAPQASYANGRVRVAGESTSFSGETQKFEIDVACDVEY